MYAVIRPRSEQRYYLTIVEEEIRQILGSTDRHGTATMWDRWDVLYNGRSRSTYSIIILCTYFLLLCSLLTFIALPPHMVQME